GYFSNRGSRYSPVHIQGVKELRVDNTEFNLHQWKPNAVSNLIRSAIIVTNTETIDKIDLNNIFINSPDITARSLITKFTDAQTTTINNIYVGRISASGGGFGANKIIAQRYGTLNVGNTTFRDINSVLIDADLLSIS